MRKNYNKKKLAIKNFREAHCKVMHTSAQAGQGMSHTS